MADKSSLDSTTLQAFEDLQTILKDATAVSLSFLAALKHYLLLEKSGGQAQKQHNDGSQLFSPSGRSGGEGRARTADEDIVPLLHARRQARHDTEGVAHPRRSGRADALPWAPPRQAYREGSGEQEQQCCERGASGNGTNLPSC